MSPSPMNKPPLRGEIWFISFDPVTGAEIAKTRPAVVVSLPAVGRLPLRIVVPVTEWQDRFENVPWLVKLEATERNGLTKDSAADAFQVKSVSLKRFDSHVGSIAEEQIEEVCEAIALCVGA